MVRRPTLLGTWVHHRRYRDLHWVAFFGAYSLYLLVAVAVNLNFKINVKNGLFCVTLPAKL